MADRTAPAAARKPITVQRANPVFAGASASSGTAASLSRSEQKRTV
jgi:hypothetical protein